MAQVRSDFAKGMLKEMYKYYFEEYDMHPEMNKKLLREESSNASHEKGTVVVGPGLLMEKTGEFQDAPDSDPGEAQTTIGKNRTFHSLLSLSMETVEDHQRVENLIRRTAADWGREVPRTRETFFAQVFNNGGLTAGDSIFNNGITGVDSDGSGDLIYDGLPLFNLSGNTRTSQVGGATYYNGLAITLSHDNLETALQLMESTNSKDERDLIVDISPDTLLVPRALKETANRIVNSELRPSTANNDTNVHNGELDVMVWKYLTDTDAWFVMERQSASIIRQERMVPKIDYFRDPKNNSYNAVIRTRFGARIDNWRHIVASNFATS